MSLPSSVPFSFSPSVAVSIGSPITLSAISPPPPHTQPDSLTLLAAFPSPFSASPSLPLGPDRAVFAKDFSSASKSVVRVTAGRLSCRWTPRCTPTVAADATTSTCAARSLCSLLAACHAPPLLRTRFLLLRHSPPLTALAPAPPAVLCDRRQLLRLHRRRKRECASSGRPRKTNAGARVRRSLQERRGTA